MDSWQRRRRNKTSNYCVWRFVEPSPQCLLCQCQWWLLSCIYLAPVLINELDISPGIDTVWPWNKEDILFSIEYRISLQSFRSVCFKIMKTRNEIIKQMYPNMLRYLLPSSKARKITDPQNTGKTKPLRHLYTGLQSWSPCLVQAAKLDKRQARKERKFMHIPRLLTSLGSALIFDFSTLYDCWKPCPLHCSAGLGLTLLVSRLNLSIFF